MIIKLLPDFRIKDYTIENIKLLLGVKFRNRIYLSYDITHHVKETETVRHYTNGSLWCVSKITKKNNARIIESFDASGKLFGKDVIEYHSDNSISSCYSWVKNMDGSISEGIEVF